MPLVSVIMSVYNGERYLAQAVESILAQTETDFEFIIINDGSTDGTAELLRSYATRDTRIIVLDQSNHGLTVSLNRALSEARGTYIARMDADDISAPDRLKKQIARLATHPDYGCVGSDILRIDEHGAEKGVEKLSRFDIVKRLPKRNTLVHGSLMFRAEVVTSLGGYRTDYRYAQDYDLLLRLLSVAKVGCVPEVLYQLRETKNSVTSRHLFSQLSCTARAKYEHHLRVRHGSGTTLLKAWLWVGSYVYTFFIIYKAGLPALKSLIRV